MKTIVLVLCLTVGALATISPLLLSSEQVSAQMMMNPNMMRNFTMANGSWLMNPNMMGPMMMNPNMMGPMMMNPNMMGPMMTSSQNITGSIKLMPTMFNYVSSQIKVNLTDAVASAQKQLGEKSRIVAANLGIENGYLKYTVCAIDHDMNIQRLIIDPGNGKVLLTQKLPWHNMMNPWMMSHMWR
jgi:hypothetical protein